jgi:hypothetical protein
MNKISPENKQAGENMDVTTRLCPRCERLVLDLKTDTSFDWSGWVQCIRCGYPFNATSMLTTIQERSNEISNVILVDLKPDKRRWSLVRYELAMKLLSNRVTSDLRVGFYPVYKDEHLSVLRFKHLDVAFVYGKPGSFEKYLAGLKHKWLKKRIADPIYGGYHSCIDVAERDLSRGCPPSEIMLAYMGCREYSFLSKIRLDGIKQLIDEHVEECRHCRFLVTLILEHG